MGAWRGFNARLVVLQRLRKMLVPFASLMNERLRRFSGPPTELRARARGTLFACETAYASDHELDLHCCHLQGFRVSSALLVFVALAGVGPSVAQNVLGIDFGSEWIKLAVVQRSAGVQIVLNEVTHL